VRPDLRHERSLARRGMLPVAGLDEAGRGALAGPLFAAAVILPVGRSNLAAALHDVRDSKVMTAHQRRACAENIRALALDWAVGQATCDEVDRLGPLEATRLAMRRALQGLSLPPQHLLLDHLRLPDVPLDQTPVTHGDARVLSIAAASVLAKVGRDQAMDEFALTFPTYGFSRHKGYGTAGHLQALRRWGPCPIHRLSFEPVSVLLPTVPR
jgi:ribonuclease HII